MILLLLQNLPYLPSLARFQENSDETVPYLCFSILGALLLLELFTVYKRTSLNRRMANPQGMLEKKDYPALLAALRYKLKKTDPKSTNTRTAAAKTLQQLGAEPTSDKLNTRIVKALIQAAADKDTDVRAAAVAALGAYAARTPDANLRAIIVPALRNSLSDHGNVRLAAVQSLGSITSAWALEPIATANQQNNPEAEKRPLSVLSSLNQDVGPGMFNLFSQIKDGTSIRAAAARVLGAFALVDPAVLVPLQTALENDPDEEIRHAAIRGIGVTAHPRAIEILAGRLGKAVPPDRAVIAGALVQHGWKPADPRAAAAFAIASGQWDDLKALGKPAIEQLVADLLYCEHADWSTKIPEALAGFGVDAVPLLLPVLNDANAIRRKHAALALGKIGARYRDSRIAPGLGRLLDDRDLTVVQTSLDALGSALDEQSIPLLANFLKKGASAAPEKHREAAFYALQQLGEPATTALASLLDEPDESLRKGAVQALKRMNWQPQFDATGAKYWINLREFERCVPIGEAAVAPLVKALVQEGPKSSHVIAPVLSAIGSPSTAPLLVQLLENKESQVILSGLAALGLLADPRAINPLVDFLKKTRDNVQYRDGALAALQKTGLPAAPALIPLLDDRSVSFREGVARALKGMDWQPGLDASGANYWIALHEFERCAAIGEAAVQPLVQALAQEGPKSSQVIVPVLAAIGSPSTTALLLNLLNENNNQAVLSGLGALGQLADPRAVNPLVDFLKKTRDNVQYRKGALAALQEIGQPAIPALIALLDDQNLSFREEVAQALKGMDWQPGLDASGANYWITFHEFGRCAAIGEAAVQPLVSALVPKEEKYHDTIFAILRQIGRPAIPALVTLLGSRIFTIREKATLALQSMDWQPGLDQDGANYWINLHQVERCVPIGAPAAGPLVWMLDSGWGENRLAAANALAAIGGQEVASSLLPLLARDHLLEVRRLTTSVLDKIGWQPPMDENGASYWIAKGQTDRCIEIGPRAVPALLPYLEQWDESTSATIRALGKIGDPRAAGPLVNIAFSHSSQKETARAQLKNFGPAIIEPLIPHLQDADFDNRRFAAENLLYVYTHAALSENDRALLLRHRATITEPRSNKNDHRDNGHSESNHYRANDCSDGHSDDHTDYNTHTDRGIGLPFTED